MNISKYGRDLDRRDEMILGIIAAFIPLVALMAMVY